ncbi:hypothetical protein FQN60_007277 [Etheostoma spectabile]|uniref:Uncharacterized protein n=1 Tax=Etheostoma spectabile TaxID=54343 RepID=A0A5J5C9U7_9PERO|nr:hypothetical protein FQN60_006060 [Etheostoma spectabile]KAA8578718.1 hypothetical protein FQN60_007277 [Etheostoma spectabile]
MDRRIRLSGESRFCGVSNLQRQNSIEVQASQQQLRLWTR